MLLVFTSLLGVQRGLLELCRTYIGDLHGKNAEEELVTIRQGVGIEGTSELGKRKNKKGKRKEAKNNKTAEGGKCA